MGDTILNKVYYGIVKKLLKEKKLLRTILVLTITDGRPTHGTGSTIEQIFKQGEAHLIEAINKCVRTFEKSDYGKFGICFSFAQIGTDKDASEYFGRLDGYDYIGKNIDCTSEYHMEKAECLRKTGHILTDAEWVNKIIIGPIDPSYDDMDE